MSKLSQQSTLGGFLKKKSSSKTPEIDDSDDDTDISIVKVVPSQKKSIKWVSSSFDDFAAFLPSKPACSSQLSDATTSHSKKRMRDSVHPEPIHQPSTAAKGKKLKKISRDDLWADKHKPSNKGDLAVHKKKVDDVETWLQDRTMSTPKHVIVPRMEPPILLLTGPAGVGKTATVQVLCKELGLEVQEWTNPIQPSYNSEQLLPSAYNSFAHSRLDSGYSESQATQFKNFLLRANKYSSLQIGDTLSSSHKIIFIEELPNIFFRDSSLFHNILRKYRQVGRCPLVFIISDTTSGESNERQLFPADLQAEICIESISFNPVAPTMMVKVLARIANSEYNQRSISAVPSSPVIESIAMSSAGDVRSAINSLQFACSQDTLDLKHKCTPKRTAPKKSSSGSGRRLKYETSQRKDTNTEAGSSIGARDTSCFLFHAIGKVLYCKRGDPKEFPEHCLLPSRLSQHDRDPLLLNPEEVVEKSHLSGNYFASFLHQNYVDFYTDIDDVVRASQYISDADFFTAEWASRSAMENYAASIATRGVIHSNSSIARHDSKRTGLGWKPIHKSQWFTIQRQVVYLLCRQKRNIETASALFKGYHWDPKMLLTEVLPYMNQINVTLHSPAQISFTQEMCRYSTFGSGRRLEKLEETDVLDGEDEAPPATSQPTQAGGDEVPLSQNKVQVPDDEEDDDPVIEDYDDEDYEDLFLSDDSFT
ncbi:cell cycle checkpoint protein RAD17-like [Haliotis rubra]|uniref:cell cycle checkpoint protein RAD17-like n=1 Tax=Haliotis rubra TaxID=36100 RepID=UPI001EE5DE50|nr:cell cycle checkpoint protein RAD17-like [Haliotis rubra]